MFTPTTSVASQTEICHEVLESLEQQMLTGVVASADATKVSLQQRMQRCNNEELRKLIDDVQKQKDAQIRLCSATRAALSNAFEKGLQKIIPITELSTQCGTGGSCNLCGSYHHLDNLLHPVPSGMYTIKSLVRNYALGPQHAENTIIIDALQRHAFTADRSSSRPPTVLVPGAGLCGLCCQIAQALSETRSSSNKIAIIDAVDISLPHLVLSAGFIDGASNSSGRDIPSTVTVYPDAATTGCVRSTHQKHPALGSPSVGGIAVSSRCLPEGVMLRLWHLNFCADTLSILPSRDIVVTSFFLDAVPDVFSAIECIRDRLSDSGLWINLGPLKYHGYHAQGPRPTWSQITQFATSVLCFEILEEQILDGVPYFRDSADSPGSVLSESYRCIFSVMRKCGNSESK